MKKKIKHNIIFTHGGGRFGNQIINQINFIAFCMEYPKFSFLNLAFLPYYKLVNKQNKRLFKYPPEAPNHYFLQIVYRMVPKFNIKLMYFSFFYTLSLIHYISRALPHSQSIVYRIYPQKEKKQYGEQQKFLNLNSSETIDALKKKKITYMAGWPIRCWDLVKKYQEEIRKTFKISEKYNPIIQHQINKLRKKHSLLIGIFIRHDDYRQWKDGRYFFNLEQYVEWVSQVRTMFQGQNPGFLIIINEKEDVSCLGENIYMATGEKSGSGHFIENLGELSECDYILSPPSTFGVIAAFLGNKPLIAVYKNKQKIDKTDILKNPLWDALVHPEFKIVVK